MPSKYKDAEPVLPKVSEENQDNLTPSSIWVNGEDKANGNDVQWDWKSWLPTLFSHGFRQGL